MIEVPADSEILLIHFFNAGNMQSIEIDKQISHLYSDTVMSNKIIRIGAWFFNSDRINMYEEQRNRLVRNYEAYLSSSLL